MKELSIFLFLLTFLIGNSLSQVCSTLSAEGATCSLNTDCCSNYCDPTLFVCESSCAATSSSPPYDIGCYCEVSADCASTICTNNVCSSTCSGNPPFAE